MDETTVKTPGKWLDEELSEQEASDILRLISLMPELDNEKDPDIIIDRLSPYLNSFVHLMYRLTKGKYGLSVHDDGTVTTREGQYFDIVGYTCEFIIAKYDLNALVTAEEVREALPQLASKIPQKHVMPNNKLANSLTKDIIDAGTIELDVGRKKGEITTRCILSYEGDNVKLTSRAPFTEYDRQVADAVTSLYEYGDKSHVVTPATVYRAMVHATEAETPSPQQIGAVTRSLDKMRFVRVQIDCSEELKRRKIELNGTQITGGRIDTYLLALERVEVEAGGKKIIAYKVMKTPILYDYSRLTGQVATVPAALLDIRDETGGKVANTERRIAIKGILMRRVSIMKGRSGVKQSRHILYDRLYEDIGEKDLSRKDQQSIREYIDLVLDSWKRSDFIKDYRELTSGRKKIGVEIVV